MLSTLTVEDRLRLCEPYKFSQKGAIENANRLIQTKLFKQIDSNNLEQSEIDKCIHLFNTRLGQSNVWAIKHRKKYFTDN